MNVDNIRMSFIEHLEELRRRLIGSLIAFAIAFLIAYYFRDYIFKLITRPVGTLVFLSLTEAFMSYIKISLMGGLVLASPVIFYNIWAFLSPALYNKEKKFIGLFLPFTLLLFLTGIVFGYFLLPTTIKFLLSFQSESMRPMISANYYIGFVLMLFLACGVSFEMPIVIMILTKLGIVNSKILIKQWKYAVLLIFILAAVITPSPDAFTQCIVAVPMLFLYFISIIIAKMIE